MGALSRNKGKRGEREVVAAFRDAGFSHVERDLKDNQVDGDILNAPAYTEVRWRETLSIPAWVRECIEKSRGRSWALWFRRSREPWCVVVSAEEYLNLLAAKHLPREEPTVKRHYITAGGNVIEIGEDDGRA
jgi:hypothetical protein